MKRWEEGLGKEWESEKQGWGTRVEALCFLHFLLLSKPLCKGRVMVVVKEESYFHRRQKPREGTGSGDESRSQSRRISQMSEKMAHRLGDCR